jgi:phosphatidylserine/phosphatidylglycerophosphate/cardiolipin synthase-like enzyme
VTDGVSNLLDEVDCTGPGDLAGDHSGSVAATTVQVAIFDFSGRKLIRGQLEDLADQGCDVTVIYAEMSYGTLSALYDYPNLHLMQVDDQTYPLAAGGTGDVFVHDKYVLVSGGLQTGSGTEPNQNLVLTGSQNFTQHGLHYNDEATISLQQTMTSQSPQTVFGQYENNWNHLVQVAEQISPSP